MIDSGTSGIGGVMAEKGENPRGNLKRWRHPYNFDAEILFGYAGNIVFYNIVSVSIDMIAYERINAENAENAERLTTSSFPAMSRSGSAEMWIGCDETEIF
ncbi:hypothetical protein DPMN_009784 [Dreissena polymorpha]|uniref:Uncharacterized protein n=1 Tax=Dreissena polymorpha TaxID=45954 RepID=A0A9D4N094_DREPO|nr:hypothetical protein DPMN_009784 [Dreissena polymorpha]